MTDDLLYHLDLCILAYHLYHQTLIWPMDPYYERMAWALSNRRENFMAEIRKEFKGLIKPASEQPLYRGPGELQAWPGNTVLDPIITKYKGRLSPWRASFVKADDAWEFISPTKNITDKIAAVHVCSYKTGINPNGANGVPQIEERISSNEKASGKDELYCFEGGTGAIEGKTIHAWSMLGFVLVEHLTGDDYNVHVTFRGSRSGAGGRAAKQGLLETGNPDWVTDMDFWQIKPDAEISASGGTSRGFKTCMKSTLPSIVGCLNDIQSKKNKAPLKIYATGHSLGGALAVMFASAMTLGSKYGPNGSKLTGGLQNWPWATLRLITFSAPTVGDELFAQVIHSKLNTNRVYVAWDMITSAVLDRNGVHVGAVIRLPRAITIKSPFSPHEPAEVRKELTAFLKQSNENIDAYEQNPSFIGSYASFSKLYEAQERNITAACLPDFDTHLLQYLEILRKSIGNTASYALGIRQTTREMLEINMRSIISDVQNGADLIAKPPLDLDDSYFTEAVGLYRVLSHLAKHGALSQPQINALTKL